MKCSSILAAAVLTAFPAAAQTVSGFLDVVDQQSVFGWACNPGDPTTVVTVELWAVDSATGGWTLIDDNVHADKQRIDVGAAGVCGTGPNSNYHGFERPIFPDSILRVNANYTVYAYYRPANQFLNGSPRSIGFPESGLPTSGIWRTDLDDPNNKSPSFVSCIWPFLGANLHGNQLSDQLWIMPGAGGTWPQGVSAPLGYNSVSNWCINYDPASPHSSFVASNSATNAASWPTSNFWVIHANYEPAYSQLNSGPPGQSQPLNAGGVYSLAGNAASFTLGIDNTRKPAGFDGIPFLSFGAQMGRGSAGPLVVFDPSTSEATLQFTATKQVESGTTAPYHSISALVEAMWGGEKRIAWVRLQEPATARVHWNWNYYPSFFYPGAEIDLISVDDLASRCSLFVGTKLDGAPVGSAHSYSIPIGGLFKCIEGAGGLTWSSLRPAGPLFITGVHLSIEQGDGRADNKMTVNFTVPRLVR